MNYQKMNGKNNDNKHVIFSLNYLYDVLVMTAVMVVIYMATLNEACVTSAARHVRCNSNRNNKRAINSKEMQQEEEVARVFKALTDSRRSS